ncbi:MAG: hypothetical protein KF841_08395 [Phycisphaerae bacterium]|nr:hypothetical protein [Phycisphaerae bacterium]
MDEAMIQRLEKSFKLLAPRGPELVDHFYAHLFSKNPTLRKLFPKDMQSQKQQLLASLILVVQNLRKPDALRQPLLDLGRRHVAYQAEPEHYPVVRDTLIGVMKDMAGNAWNDQLTQDWTDAINLVATVMIEGHKLANKSRTSTGIR